MSSKRSGRKKLNVNTIYTIRMQSDAGFAPGVSKENSKVLERRAMHVFSLPESFSTWSVRSKCGNG